MKPEPKQSKPHVNGAASDSPLKGKFAQATSGLTGEVRTYAVMALGLFLFLFSLGYFQVLKIVLGGLGIALMGWGAMKSGLLQLGLSYLDKALSYFTKK